MGKGTLFELENAVFKLLNSNAKPDSTPTIGTTTFTTSLPTPPSTAHREEKENRAHFEPSASASRVAWSDKNQYHAISPFSRPSASQTSASNIVQPKSILKKSSCAILPYPDDEPKKETTPEPSDPLADLRYLEGPVSRVLAPDASMRDLIEAYSVLAARLRLCVPDTEADPSWPLFQPLRHHREAFVDALVRDLARALIDPITPAGRQDEEDAALSFPSPKSPNDSPKKKRGMSEEEVKNARDLCATCQAVIKLLAVMFTLPAVHQIFTDAQLGFILTQVLAIPLATELPTHNARKTNALAIWLLLTQRLPESVLAPAKDRIAYALRRGIEGELGKEGKKGSMNDGLKAIHDLSIAYPAIFVPAFAELLPSILAHLLAPTLALRTSACHALGGLAYAAASLPPSSVHAHMSDVVVAYLTRPPSPTDKPHSPTKDLPIVRTLRTTLNANDVAHAAQGPVWAWCVLAALVVLLGPAVFVRENITHTITALLSLGLRHPKSTVRALGCIAWRAVTWAYFQPLPKPKRQAEDNDDEEEVLESEGEEEVVEEQLRERLDEMWKMVQGVVECGAGIATLVALLGREQSVADERTMQRMLWVLRAMLKKGGQTVGEALDSMMQLVSLAPASEEQWNMQSLLAPGLFSALPGLLTAEWKGLPQVVRPLFEQGAQEHHIRPLSRDELSIEWVFNGLLHLWRMGLNMMRLSWGRDIPAEITEIWSSLLKANIAILQDAGDHEATVLFAGSIVSVLVNILKDQNLDISADADEATSEVVPTSPSSSQRRRELSYISPSRWNLGLKLLVVRELWEIARTVFPRAVISGPAEKLLACLNRYEVDLVDDMDIPDDVRKQWAYLSAEVAFVCDVGELREFWTGRRAARVRREPRDWSEDVRAVVWRNFVHKLKECAGTWEAAVVMLGVPFIESNVWEMSSEDMDLWASLLRDAISNALDYGVDSVTVLDQVSSMISSNHTPALASSTRVADLLLSNLEINEARLVPSDLMEFVNDTLISTYPPEPRNKIVSRWLLRSLTHIIDVCPIELSLTLFEMLQEGLIVWIVDERKVFTTDEYSMEILPVYQTFLLCMQSLPISLPTLETVAPLLESAVCGREDIFQAASQAFAEFWQATYASVSEPRRGWPKKVLRCLAALSGDRVHTTELDDTLDEEVDSSPVETRLDCSPSSSELLMEEPEELDGEEEEAVVKYLVPSPELGLAPLPALLDEFRVSPNHAESGSANVVTPPSTPKSVRGQLPVITPTRPQKSSGKNLVTVLLGSSSSPVLLSTSRAPVTPRRSPQSPFRRVSTLSARRSVQNKENTSLRRAVPSVAERIAMISPGGSSMLGKRPLADEALEEKSPKRSRVDIASIGPALGDITVNSVTVKSDIPQDHAVDVDAIADRSQVQSTGRGACGSPEKSSELDDAAIVSPSCTPRTGRKRKGIFLDAVEVPTMREVLWRQRQRISQAPRSCSQLSARIEEPQVLRRTRSATKLLGEEPPFFPLDHTPCKRRKITPLASSHLLRRERGDPMVGSDDSIMLASPTKQIDLPSDDDPHDGQVTPLGVVSPALRRVRSDEFDLSSDDSVMSTSPSRDRVARRLASLPGGASTELMHMRSLPDLACGSSSLSVDA